MSILINIENYEAFYLDYLEGNLGEEQMRAFLLFLEQHPELKIEDELPSFAETGEAKLDAGFISGLKMFDASETISETNYEQFMIASVEEVIPATKQVELHDFMSRRPHLETDLDLYKKTRLEADNSIVYPDKNKLRRGTVIPMYVRVAAVAASILLILMFIPWNTSPESMMSAQLASLSVDLDMKAGTQKQETTVSDTQVKTHYASAVQNENPSENNLSFQEEKEIIAQLAAKKVKRVETVPAERELVALDLKVEKSSKSEENEVDYYLGLSEMKNPVPFITNSIKSRFKQDVDLRTAKASKNKQGGFYLKIGKFEFSRKTAPVREDILAANP